MVKLNSILTIILLVVVAMTYMTVYSVLRSRIPDLMDMYVVQPHTHTHTHLHIHIHTHIYIYLYLVSFFASLCYVVDFLVYMSEPLLMLLFNVDIGNPLRIVDFTNTCDCSTSLIVFNQS